MKNKFLRGWGRCFKVILQTHAPENFRSRRWGAELRVQLAAQDVKIYTPPPFTLNRVKWGVWWVPNFFSPIRILLFMLLGGPLKIWEPYYKPFLEYISKKSPFLVKIGLIGRVGGSPKFLFHCNPPLFVT